MEERLDVVGLQAAGLGALHVFADPLDPAGVHGVVSEGALFHQVAELAAVEGMVQHGLQAGPHLGLIAVADGLDEQFTERPAVELELAEHVEDLAAERLARLLELFQKPAVDVAFAGLLRDQVPEVADLGLADAVDAAEPLLEAVRVPRQVVVDHQVSALKIDALARGVGGQQHLHLGVVPERLLRLQAILAAHAAVDDDHGLLAAEQRRDPLLQIVQRVAVLGEDDELLVRRRLGWGILRVARRRSRRYRGCPGGEPW